MKGILPDNDIHGYVSFLVRIWQSNAWREVWDSLALNVYTFDDLGLSLEATDSEIWHACQAAAAVLVTANRNDDGAESLAATIRAHGLATSLPVITLANVKRMHKDRAYAKGVAERALERLLDIENYRGVGRIYLP